MPDRDGHAPLRPCVDETIAGAASYRMCAAIVSKVYVWISLRNIPLSA